MRQGNSRPMVEAAPTHLSQGNSYPLLEHQWQWVGMTGSLGRGVVGP